MGHPRAGRMARCYSVVCIHCEQGDTFGFDKNLRRAQKLARRHGWSWTYEGWAHKECHKEWINVQAYA